MLFRLYFQAFLHYLWSKILFMSKWRTFEKTVIMTGTRAAAHVVVYSLQVNKAPFLNLLGLQLSCLHQCPTVMFWTNLMIFFHACCYKKWDIFLWTYKSALRTRKQQRQPTSIHPEIFLPDPFTNWIHAEIPDSLLWQIIIILINRLLVYILIRYYFFFTSEMSRYILNEYTFIFSNENIWYKSI